MTIQVSPFNQTIDSEEFIEFCKTAHQDANQPAAVNMWHNDWKEQPHTLPYILFNEKRFNEPRGEFFLLKENNIIIGCSGIYISNFSNNICLAGCRTWVTKEYRNNSLVRDYLLPAQKDWAVNNKVKVIALSFNHYNRNIITIWRKRRFGEVRTPREPYHLFYTNFNEVPFLVNVQHTPQWVIYEKLDPNFEFNWKSIKS
jgi:hypothetical protein